MAPFDQQRLLAILDYWHKVEFFVPYGLDQRLDELEDWQSKVILPQACLDAGSTQWNRMDVPVDQEIISYSLFLGVFDKSAVLSLCEKLVPVPAPLSVAARFEEEARADLEGQTCFARISLDKSGCPLAGSISISTAPWALGQALSHGLGALGAAEFESARDDLVNRFNNFFATRVDSASGPLTASEVLSLHQTLCQWAGFYPGADQPLAVLEVKTKARTTQALDDASDQEPATLQEEEEEDEDDPVDDLDILNSFYIGDLERAMHSVRTGNVPAALRQYLTPLADDQRLDLYSNAGRELLYQRLRPRHLSIGHWLGNAEHPMSLMQQFALNQAGADLQYSGLFAVNGPPGTGKTTLLRDLFADNIVRRARVLSGLSSVNDAFSTQPLTVRFMDEQRKVWPLIEALTGFEMVVASSNNAAVENISVDLTKRSALDAAWQSVGYLQPVAHNLAVKVKKSGPVFPKGRDVPWGLVSCALGNAGNRRRFREGLFFNEFESDKTERPQTLWKWFDQAQSTGFAEARAAFSLADKAVSAALAERERLAQLLEELGDGTQASYVAQAQQAHTQLRAGVEAADAAVRENLSRQQVEGHECLLLVEQQRLIDRTSPGWWARLWRTQSARTYIRQCAENAKLQLESHARLRALKSEAVSLSSQLAKLDAQRQACERSLAQRSRDWETKTAERAVLEQRLGVPVLPAALADLELPQFQINGLWHDAQFARLRSALFAAALQLQQAWLHEAGQPKNRMRSNLWAISNLLNNKQPEDAGHVLPIWQNLFMIVPVVSTTFASFANQFRGLQSDALGWVFIDEAGQAVPQAAVGALWRARRCVVVGDPLQIEPVFTLPRQLITALGQLSPFTQDDSYAPHQVSVQRLADQASRFGTYAPMMGQRLWIGSPLRVHRRCYDPMFSLANRMAYDDKMVLGLAQRNAPDAPLIDLPSGWVDIRGNVTRKQVVYEQVEFMAKVIVCLFQRDQALPGLYVVSPFKAVRQALRQHLMQVKWAGAEPRRTDLKEWLKRNVGTVHTFQGKEQDTVFMILGADRDHAGGAQWAASKPNLLNVALTRARHRVYLVGDIELWGELEHFSLAARGEHALARLTRNAFGILNKSGRAQASPDRLGQA
ncbi:hypothetical protein CYL20_14225 [Pseudomonas palleroniana]|uniref:AAA domain-containing protein n=1 Tax=Pseudomonas palleroniana TaxID=191390 RepID=A0A2L1JB12_9PSED|nr:hypothetical protein CYL20_14225 [Pseudomonas palleroniana]